MDNLCIDCNKKIDPRSKRCYSCSKKGILNNFYGKKHSEEEKRKAVATRKKNGSYVVSDETRRQLSKIRMGHEVSIETRRKISSGNTGKTGLKMEKHPNWKGGKYKRISGYIMILKPNHPNCNSQGYVLESRLVMEKHLDRYLEPEEVVHHINRIKDDNRIENLKLFKNNVIHLKHHHPKGRRIGGLIL